MTNSKTKLSAFIVLLLISLVLYKFITFSSPEYKAIDGDEIDNVMCKFATVGHLYSITSDSKLLNELSKQLNNEKFDVIIFLVDLTKDGTDSQWEKINKFRQSLKSDVLFVPGNHDLKDENSLLNWQKNVGYMSNKIKIKGCNFVLLNSVNSRAANYNWNKIVSGNGIDSLGIQILNGLKENELNMVFMHHTLYSSDLWKADHEVPNQFDENAIIQEKLWRKNVSDLLTNRVSCVYTGDWHSRRTSISVQDNILYIANGLAKIESESHERLTYITTYIKQDSTIINRIIPFGAN